MYARVIRAQVPPEHFDQVLAATKARNVPMVMQLPGFKAGYWSGDKETGKIATFVVFENEEGIRAAQAGLEQMRPVVEQFGVRLESVENLKLLITEGAAKTTQHAEDERRA
jgi:hypothetical protein